MFMTALVFSHSFSTTALSLKCVKLEISREDFYYDLIDFISVLEVFPKHSGRTMHRN